jgi:hypothetical protein
MPKEFNVRREVTVAASAEAAFDAVATAAGNAAWLFPNEMDDGDPAIIERTRPTRFAVRHEAPGWFNALTYEIEAIDGGRCTVRYAHSGIFTDDWETQLDAVGQHTDFYLHTLGEYLEHFAGRTATYVGGTPAGVLGPVSSASADGFTRLLGALGVPSGAVAGDKVTLASSLPAPIEGVVDYATANFLGVRTADELYCFFGRNAFGAPVAMSVHSFAPVVDAQAAAEVWSSWMAEALS